MYWQRTAGSFLSIPVSQIQALAVHGRFFFPELPAVNNQLPIILHKRR